jgi:hypothetical protein
MAAMSASALAEAAGADAVDVVVLMTAAET